MSHSVVLTDIVGDRVSVFPWSLHVRCSRYTFNVLLSNASDVQPDPDVGGALCI